MGGIDARTSRRAPHLSIDPKRIFFSYCHAIAETTRKNPLIFFFFLQNLTNFAIFNTVSIFSLSLSFSLSNYSRNNFAKNILLRKFPITSAYSSFSLDRTHRQRVTIIFSHPRENYSILLYEFRYVSVPQIRSIKFLDYINGINSGYRASTSTYFSRRWTISINIVSGARALNEPSRRIEKI